MNTKLIISILVLVAGLLIATSAHAQVAISEDGVTFPDDTVQTTAFVLQTTYTIGDNGPAGGIVFYITPGSLHGLEAAPEDQSFDAIWGCYDTALDGADRTYVGAGGANTQDILTGCQETGVAARVVLEYELNGFTDWFLPSKDELHMMYQNKDLIGGFAHLLYWSSSEINNFAAWGWNFDVGGEYAGIKSNVNLATRAVRAF